MNEFIISVLASSFLLLDTTYIGQFLLSQPVVMIPLLSCITRDPQIALKTAVNLELVFLGRLAVGASIPPSAGFAAAVFWSGYVLLGNSSVTALVLLFFCAMIAAYWGRALEILIRTANEPLSRWSFYSYAKSLQRWKFYRGGFLSIIGTYFLYVVNIAVLGFGASKITGMCITVCGSIEMFYRPTMQFFWDALPVISVLFLLDRFMEKGRARFFYYGALGGILGGILNWIL